MTKNNRVVVTDKIAKLMSEKDRKAMGVLLPEERVALQDAQCEKKLQSKVESWLTLHGYRRRTPEEIKRPGNCTGWFIHMHQAKRNPIILDLLILLSDGRYLEIELKTLTGKPSPEQKVLLERGGKLCRTLESFIKILENKP